MKKSAKLTENEKSHMSSDTIRDVTNVLERGYYREGQTFGKNGWSAVYSRGAGAWDKYQLYIYDNLKETITAKNNQTAIRAFQELYNLDGLNYTIEKKVTRYIEILRVEVDE